jgi:hypothetical protein
MSVQIVMQEVLRRSFAHSNTFHAAARGFRNRLLITSGIVVLVVVALIVLQATLPEAKMFELPSDSTDLSRWTALLLIMLFGSVGALITAIPAMAAVPQVRSPYNFPLQQALVKIVVGSLSAVVGVVTIGNPGVATGFASLEAVLGIAIVFGAGQQAVTRFLDKRAGKIIESAP